MANVCGPTGLYSFSKSAFTVDGIKVTGFSEGDDVIMIEPTTELTKQMVGADGSSVVSVTADYSVMITIKLMYTSPFNQYLHAKAKLLRSLASQAIFPVGFVDMGNGETGGCTSASVAVLPTISRGGTAPEMEWKIFCPCWLGGEVEINRG